MPWGFGDGFNSLFAAEVHRDFSQPKSCFRLLNRTLGDYLSQPGTFDISCPPILICCAAPLPSQEGVTPLASGVRELISLMEEHAKFSQKAAVEKTNTSRPLVTPSQHQSAAALRDQQS